MWNRTKRGEKECGKDDAHNDDGVGTHRTKSQRRRKKQISITWNTKIFFSFFCSHLICVFPYKQFSFRYARIAWELFGIAFLYIHFSIFCVYTHWLVYKNAVVYRRYNVYGIPHLIMLCAYKWFLPHCMHFTLAQNVAEGSADAKKRMLTYKTNIHLQNSSRVIKCASLLQKFSARFLTLYGKQYGTTHRRFLFFFFLIISSFFFFLQSCV